MTAPIESQPLQVTVNGREWFLFPCSFVSADGPFCFNIYALSIEHAAALLAELKETAVLDGGPIEKVIPA